jgi:tripartite-type tricarboxylate transporter receptor subunit TctC
MLTRRSLLVAPLAAPLASPLASPWASPALAQPAWQPDRPIRIIVPYTPGAINDILARLVGERMGDVFGQIGVVENKPGASGSLGIATAAQAAPDGQTIAVANTANLCMNPFLFANTGYDPQKDITPICVSVRLMNALGVRADGPIRDLRDLIARAKAAPGKMSYASSGAGSSPHLAAELLKHQAGIDVVHVPYRGSAPGMADLIGGRVDFTIDNLPNVLAQVRGGKVRALAVTGSERDPTMPDVPTFQEAGVPGYEIYIWFGFVGPAALPDRIRDRLAEGITRIVQGEETREKLRGAGASLWPQTPQQFRALVGAELNKWGEVIRSAGLKLE